jgi:uncharacterized membrane protein YgcG
MKTILLAAPFALLVFTGCSSVYKMGQTPDDVYYSPTRPEGAIVRETREDRRDTYYSSYDDWMMQRDIRMRLRDPRWRNLDWDMGYNPFLFSNWNGYYYNPFYHPFPVFSPGVITPVNPKVTTPRTTNLNAFNPPVRNYNQSNTPRNIKTGRVGSQPVRVYNNRNERSSGLGNSLRRVLDPAPTRTYNSDGSSGNWNNSNGRSYNSGSGSSSSGSSGGGGGVSRPARSGRN